MKTINQSVLDLYGISQNLQKQIYDLRGVQEDLLWQILRGLVGHKVRLIALRPRIVVEGKLTIDMSECFYVKRLFVIPGDIKGLWIQEPNTVHITVSVAHKK